MAATVKGGQQKMRRLKKTLATAFAVWGFLISGWVQADVFLVGIPDAVPGHEVELSIAVTAGTVFLSIDIIPRYEDFDEVLTLIGFWATPALTERAFGECLDGACAIFYLEGKSFAEESVLATWRFRVTDDAEDFVDTTGNRGYPFDLGVVIGATEHIPLPVDHIFTVLAVPAPMSAIPEPSSWSLTAVGMLLLIACWRTRRPR
jgi:hypothetical protein